MEDKTNVIKIQRYHSPCGDLMLGSLEDKLCLCDCSYRYEEGVCSKVPMQWKDSERTLTIGLREGTYPGMPEQIKMHVKLYLPEGAALDSKECVYTGREVKIKF